jgi:hypothetical protein
VRCLGRVGEAGFEGLEDDSGVWLDIFAWSGKKCMLELARLKAGWSLYGGPGRLDVQFSREGMIESTK